MAIVIIPCYDVCPSFPNLLPDKCLNQGRRNNTDHFKSIFASITRQPVWNKLYCTQAKKIVDFVQKYPDHLGGTKGPFSFNVFLLFSR